MALTNLFFYEFPPTLEICVYYYYIFFSTSLAEIVTSVPAGRLNNQKMMTLNDIVHSQLFLKPECRAIILSVVVRRVKELLTGPQEVRQRVALIECTKYLGCGTNNAPITNNLILILVDGFSSLSSSSLSVVWVFFPVECPCPQQTNWLY